jgi:hypothetical protein
MVCFEWKKKAPANCRGFEFISKSIGYAITIPVKSLYATTNICLLLDSLLCKDGRELHLNQNFL